MPTDRRHFLTQLTGWGGLWAAGGFGQQGSWIEAAESLPRAARPPIRIGQIGVGHGHASKLSVYRDSPDYEVVGIAEPDDELRRRATTQSAFAELPWLSIEQLLSTPGLQAVLVETHVRDLLSTAQRCIDAGLSIHLDKPAGASLPDFESLLRAADERRLLVQMGYMWRYHPGVLLLKQLLDGGALGDIFSVQASIGKRLSNRERLELSEFPGGIFFELGCHLTDLVVGVLGEPAGVTSHRQQLGSDGLADNVLAVFEYPRALASVEVNALELDGGPRRRFIICGTGGTLEIQPLDGSSARLNLQHPWGDYAAGPQTLTFPRFRRYVADAADMAAILRGEKASDFSSAHDLAVQRTVLKVSEG